MNRPTPYLIVGVLLLTFVALFSRFAHVADAPEPFSKVRFETQANGQIWAEAWVEFTSLGSTLEADVEQDVVCVSNGTSKMALPSRIPFPGHTRPTKAGADKVERSTPSEPVASPDAAGYVQVYLYHLVDNRTGKEVDYYKRRFARPRRPD